MARVIHEEAIEISFTEQNLKEEKLICIRESWSNDGATVVFHEFSVWRLLYDERALPRDSIPCHCTRQYNGRMHYRVRNTKMRFAALSQTFPQYFTRHPTDITELGEAWLMNWGLQF